MNLDELVAAAQARLKHSLHTRCGKLSARIARQFAAARARLALPPKAGE